MKQDYHNEQENKKDPGKEEKMDGLGMGSRGVTRPMAEMELKKQQGEKHENADGKKGKMEGMSPEQRRQMLEMHHMQTLWVYWLIIILGAWTLISPFTFGYDVGTVSPSGGREVWLSIQQRISVLKWSDIISGLLLIIFGWRGLTPNRPVSLWICCFTGIWLTMAPILFWSPTAAGYLNATLVGALVIALTILIPGMPNMISYMKMGPTIPPGWSYNPSSWPQRWIMIVTGFLGWIVSRYLAAFQLGYIDSVWDPFFGEQSRQVLNSSMSHSLPISDAGLGAIAYTFEFLMGFMGSPARWRTMPWMVAVFGILVIPLGLVHIFLVISQPVLVGAWCTFCLLAAAIMLPMIPLEVDEVIAMAQFMKKKMQQGEGFWKVFWKGGTIEGGKMEEKAPELLQLPQKTGAVFLASIWGMSFPWTLIVSTLLGIWIVFSPTVFGLGIQESVADVCHLSGSLIVVVSVICMGEVMRRGRFLNVLLGLVVAAVPWFLDGPMALNIVSSLAGLAVAGLALPLGPKTQTYAGWDDYIK